MDLTGSTAKDPKYITIFTEFQRKMWYTLSQGAVSRFYHARDIKGHYYIKKIGIIPLTFYWIVWTNSLIKIGYLLLTYNEWLGVEVHFLDQMSMWDWYLITLHVMFEFGLWRPKYPMYEILYRQWELQEDIFRKLGRPAEIARKINWTDKFNSCYYSAIVFTGTFALATQFFFTPKYALNTYAVFPMTWDSWWMQIIFCLHESFFVYQGYAYQACVMVVGQSMATSYQHILEGMTKTLYTLIELGEFQHSSDRLEFKSNDNSSSNNRHRHGDGNDNDIYALEALGSGSSSETNNRKNNRVRFKDILASGGSRGKSTELYLDPSTKSPGTEYDIETLITDYRRVMVASNASNAWIGWWMGGAEAFSALQFVSDVFMMIQLAKEPDFDLLGISFYALDACFGMLMMIRMLILLSRLAPASEDFLHGIKCYTMYRTPLRKSILKRLPCLRRVAAKLTGYSVRPQSVPTGINVLMNWYICAAMWKRPDDPSRRT